MSSRRGAAVSFQEEVVARSPEVGRYTTRIEVAEVEDESSESVFENSVSYEDTEFQQMHSFTEYEAVATRDGEEVYAFTNGAEAGPDITFAFSVGLDGATLRPNDASDNGNLLTLSQFGFGVSSDEIYYAGVPVQQNDILPQLQDYSEEEIGEEYALDGEETLVFQAYSYDGPQTRDVTEDEEPSFGGKAFNVDYEVLGGSGTIEIVLLDGSKYIIQNDEGEGFDYKELAEGSSGVVSEGYEGNLRVFVDEDDVFSTAVISVTGDLEIAVVGIDYTSNIDQIKVS